jgi:hypothetical protein
MVFYVVIEDQGETKTAYLKCGGFVLGMFSDRFQVEWDQQPHERVTRVNAP